MTTHLQHHDSTHCVRSECDLVIGPGALARQLKLTNVIEDTTCMKCLQNRREHTTREGAKCAEQIARLLG